MKKLALLILLPLILTACDDTEDDEQTEAEAKAQLLSEYRSAIPSSKQLLSSATTDFGTSAQLSASNLRPQSAGDAIYPQHAIAIAESINHVVDDMIKAIEQVVALPPTQHDSKEKQFIWGPWDYDEGYGKAIVYIQENGLEEDGSEPDFKYSYAFARVDTDGDLDKSKIVIWGGATPDPDNDELGVGITLWDFEANNAFETEYNPTPSIGPEQGRFVSVYGHTEEADDNEFVFNYSVFRNVIFETGGSPLDTEVFYGKFIDTDGSELGDAGNSVSFMDWVITADLCDDADHCFDEKDSSTTGDNETMRIQMAFFNDGKGRAEASLSGGELATDIAAVECWDALLESDYFSVNGETVRGDAAACSPVFDNTLSDLNIPTLDDIDAEDREDIICSAENGVENCN